MKTLVTLVAFAAGTQALISRTASCCFHLTASGGASGSVGQLSDGQNRIGDKSLSPAPASFKLFLRPRRATPTVDTKILEAVLPRDRGFSTRVCTTWVGT
ncbi:hypothetical protein AWENTII_005329 [Aspergillus wentii]